MRLLEDKIKRLFIEFLIPSISGAMVLALYCFVDMIAIGQGVGVNGTASTAIISPLSALHPSSDCLLVWEALCYTVKPRRG